MGADERKVPDASQRRINAEAQWQIDDGETGETLEKAEMKKLGHKLQVHQIELEMQNGEPLQARDAAEQALGRLRADEEQGATNELLRLINTTKTRDELIQRTTSFLKKFLGCEAIGIRLREGEDFPYYETIGFPEKFLEVERYLCSYNQKGELERDSTGNPLLECMCGNILCRRFDPSKPFFTPHGSFWSNCTTDLLASTSEADRQARTRNRCNGEGYESVGLFPLRYGAETFGLLQVNDKKKGSFTPEIISFLERFGDNLAIALSQHRTAAALEKSEFLLKETQRISKLGGWEYDVLTKSATFTDEIFEIFGTKFSSPEEGIQFYQPDDRSIIRDAFTKAVSEKKAFDVEARITTAQGAALWVKTSGRPIDEQEKTIKVRGYVLDITKWKLAGEAIKESEARYRLANLYNRTLIESSLDPLVAIGLNGKITDVNQATEVATGCRREELIGTDFSDYFTEPERARAGYRQAFREGQVRDYALNLRNIDGRVIPVIYNASVYRDNAGQVIGLFAAARDITELKRLEAEKENYEAQYRQLQKAESLGRMAGAIAHNFNNLLGVVLGNLELAMNDLPLGSDVRETLTDAEDAAQRAAEVSSLMLTYLGQTSGKHEPLNLSEICRRNLPMLRAALPKNVGLEVDFPSPGPTIKGSMHQIQQVLTNLATNAWEALGEGMNTIHLNVKTVSSADIPLVHRFPPGWQTQDDLYACLEVTDTGLGIAERDMEKLFDPFFTSKFTGRGLGLPVILGIVRASRGVITVESDVGCGSAFRVFLPVSTEEVYRRMQHVTAAFEIEGGGTVLLVDDEQGVRKTAKTMLSRLGFKVLEAKDGIEAVDVFRRHKDIIRYVLCDLTMPRMDGWETLAALRKLAPAIPVILSSGFDEAQVMISDHPEKPQAFLGKPYRIAALRDAIRYALSYKNGGGMA